MKTNLLKITLLSCVAFSLTNCSKDDDSVSFPEVNPLQEYLADSGFNQVTNEYINQEDYEFGFSFTPTVKGKINAIVVKIPDAQLSMRITIWDEVTATILRTETIDVASPNVEVTKIIESLELVKDKEYFITMNSNDWYDHSRTDGVEITYPITAGDIKINGYAFTFGLTQTLPSDFVNNRYAGDVSFKFQKTE